MTTASQADHANMNGVSAAGAGALLHAISWPSMPALECLQL